MGLSVIRGKRCRLAVLLALGVGLVGQAFAMLPTYGSPGPKQAVEADGSRTAPILPAAPVAPQRSTRPAAAAKTPTRVAQLFGGFPIGAPSPGESEPSPRPPTYRTLCVRLCDGYYFPISFSAPRSRFAQDARVCDSRCGAGARLYVYRNPGAEIEDMADLGGQAYRSLPTAFLYRTQYVPSCKCQPHPWEAEARDRHQAYALASAARAGKKGAAKKLKALQTVSAAARAATVGDARDARAGRERRRRGRTAAEFGYASWGAAEESMMSLGSKQARPAPRARARSGDPDWRRRVFQGY
jgi:hypothetical protein